MSNPQYQQQPPQPGGPGGAAPGYGAPGYGPGAQQPYGAPQYAAAPRPASGPGATLALQAVGVLGLVWVITFVVGIIGSAISYGGAIAGTTFLGGLLAIVLFGGLAFVSLAFLRRLDPDAGVQRNLVSLLIAGGIGTVALIVIGIVMAAMQNASYPYTGTYVVSIAVTGPLANGIEYTAILAAGAFGAILYRRERERAGSVAPGAQTSQPQPRQPYAQQPYPGQQAHTQQAVPPQSYPQQQGGTPPAAPYDYRAPQQ